MTYYNVYIGDLDDFDWNDKSCWSVGHTPQKISVLFPSAGSTLFLKIWDRILEKKLEGAQTDWGAFVAKVSKQDIVKIIEEYYRISPYPLPSHLQPELNELKQQVAALDEQKIYGLVASEL